MKSTSAILFISILIVSACAEVRRRPAGLVGFDADIVRGARVTRISEVGQPRPEQEIDLVAGSAVVLDATLVSCFPLSGANGPSVNQGFVQAGFFFVINDVRHGRWIGNTLSLESADRVNSSKGDMNGLGAGFHTLRDKYRFYLSSDTVRHSEFVMVRRLTDTTATLPDREIPEGWEPVKQ